MPPRGQWNPAVRPCRIGAILSYPRARTNPAQSTSTHLARASARSGSALAAALFTGITAWLSLGTVAFTDIDGPRLAVLPLSAAFLGIAALTGCAFAALVRAGAPAAPLLLLALLLAPWLPVPVPAAFLVWSGALEILVWVTVAAVMICEPIRRWHAEGRLRLLERTAAVFTRSPRAATAIVSAAIFSAAAWAASPSIPGGDEPHYLVIAQSLLIDGDLKIENNHRRGDYVSYHPAPLQPHYLRRGRDGQIYSIHAPGISVVVAPAFAIAGYTGTVVFLILIAAAGSTLVWHVSWLATRSAAAAWFGWAAVVSSVTTIFHAFTVFPDGVGGIVTLTGVWALLRTRDERRSGLTRVRPWFLHGVALAALPWLHTRFALLAGSLGSLVLLRLSTTRNPAGKAVAFLAAPALSALCWIGYFIAIYGAPDPSAPYGSTRDFSFAFIPGGIAGLFFDQRFGLLATAPVLACAVAGLALMVFAPGRVRPVDGLSARVFATELLFVAVPYLLTATSFAMWWGGRSAPARFAAVVLPMLAVPAACAWTAMRSRASRVTAILALGATAFISVVLVAIDGGRLAFNTRESYAFWLGHIAGLVDIGPGVPAWFRDREGEFFLDVLRWAALGGITWWFVRRLDMAGRPRSTAALVTVAGFAYAAWLMLSLSLTWHLRGGGLNPAPAQVDALRQLAEHPRAAAVRLNPPAVLSSRDLPSLLRIEPVNRLTPAGGASRNDLLRLPGVPAGRYRIRPRARGTDGWLMVGIGPDQFALRTVPLSSPPSALEVELPVAVRALVVRGDDAARQSVRSIVVEPVSIVGASTRITSAIARQAVRYGESSLFFFDGCSFAEPQAFWVGGGCSTTVVVDPDQPAAAIDLLLRNAPVPNAITIESGTWRERFELAAGEERPVRVPVDPRRTAAAIVIRTTGGFRPSEVEPSSTDGRFLGVWVRP